MCGAIDSNAISHLILHHQHPDFFELLAQLLNVITDNATVHIHIGMVVEHIKGAGNISRSFPQICRENRQALRWNYQMAKKDNPHLLLLSPKCTGWLRSCFAAFSAIRSLLTGGRYATGTPAHASIRIPEALLRTV